MNDLDIFSREKLLGFITWSSLLKKALDENNEFLSLLRGWEEKHAISGGWMLSFGHRRLLGSS